MKSPLATGSFYHIYNRGVEKRIIFESPRDYERFLKTLSYYRNYPTPRKLSVHLLSDSPPVSSKIDQKELVRIICFCLMPNHFHLLLEQLEENGITEFMRRISDSYTRYFNTKNDRVGPLLQGTFKAKLIETDEYLLQLSKYIHRNPLSLPIWKKRLSEYAFSSYPGYLNSKRRFEFVGGEAITNFFNNYHKSMAYQSFVEEIDDLALPLDLLIDEDLI